MICNTLFCIHCALFTHRDAGEKKRQYSLQFSMEKVRRCGSSHFQHGSIFKQTTGTIKRVGVFHWINTRLVMEILLNLISSPLKLITISCMRYSLPRIVSLYHLLTACLLIIYWVLSREEEHDTAGIMLQLFVCSKSVANAESAGIGVNLLKQSGGML